ncbi:hypothetical protein [Acinetobacter dispersus]|uniref:Uncharacterized protein n=1 Tax=Acinetobacter dispersus TaxID=70348 RepID=N9N3C3_9GAMM|nr:hypothetical protein [Acinetobacter dispersus]ENW97361.1 hypothetical protein F904_00199 [Acinetobacter dispersus]
MYMPEIDFAEHLKIKEKLMMQGLGRLDQIIDAELDRHSSAEIKPLTPRDEIKPYSAQTLKNRQKRLRKMNKKK